MAKKQNAANLEVYPQTTAFVSPKFVGWQSPYFSTIQAAITAGFNLIIVYSGVYQEELTISADVDIFMFPYSYVIKTAGADGALVTISGGVVRIKGYGTFIAEASSYTYYSFDISSGDLFLECSALGSDTSANDGFRIRSTASEIYLDCDTCLDLIDNQGATSPAYIYCKYRLKSILSSGVTGVTKVECGLINKIECSAGQLEVRFKKAEPANSANQIYITGGICELIEGVIAFNTSTSIYVINTVVEAGKLRMKHVRVVQAGTDVCLNAAGDVIVDNCVFVSQGTNSISGSDIINYGSVANATVLPTQAVETITVDASVE